MTTITAIAIGIGLILAIGIVCIALMRSPAVPDFKRTNVEMNEADALRAQLLRTQEDLIDAQSSLFDARAGLIGIRNAFAGQQSGTAKRAVRLAKEGLEG